MIQDLSFFFTWWNSDASAVLEWCYTGVFCLSALYVAPKSLLASIFCKNVIQIWVLGVLAGSSGFFLQYVISVFGLWATCDFIPFKQKYWINISNISVSMAIFICYCFTTTGSSCKKLWMNPGNLATITTNDNLLSQEKNIIHAIALVVIFFHFYDFIQIYGKMQYSHKHNKN